MSQIILMLKKRNNTLSSLRGFDSFLDKVASDIEFMIYEKSYYVWKFNVSDENIMNHIVEEIAKLTNEKNPNLIFTLHPIAYSIFSKENKATLLDILKTQIDQNDEKNAVRAQKINH